ncbi:hypothetical protein ACU8KH_01803 [Lachancea thermotolerans]
MDFVATLFGSGQSPFSYGLLLELTVKYQYQLKQGPNFCPKTKATNLAL